MVRPLRFCVIALMALASGSCEQRGAPGDTAGAAARGAAGIDSASAVRLVRETIVARDSGQRRLRFRVAHFAADTLGYLVTLLTDPAMPGGGGRAHVTPTGEVHLLELFR